MQINWGETALFGWDGGSRDVGNADCKPTDRLRGMWSLSSYCVSAPKPDGLESTARRMLRPTCTHAHNDRANRLSVKWRRVTCNFRLTSSWLENSCKLGNGLKPLFFIMLGLNISSSRLLEESLRWVVKWQKLGTVTQLELELIFTEKTPFEWPTNVVFVTLISVGHGKCRNH